MGLTDGQTGGHTDWSHSL